MTSRGKFIVLEGIDGCGKTTIANLLAKHLGNCLITKEPTAASKKIHSILQHRATPPSPLEFQKMYIADRMKHIQKVVMPALKKGKTVICQRYAMSTFAYGTAFGVAEKDLKHDFLKPDVIFLLDLPADLAMKRIASRKQGREYFEKREKLAKIRMKYMKLAKKFNAVVVDAKPKPERIVKKILWHMK
ncbi:MAG: dTMP kinase [Patescibacteria group bacterium]